MQAQYKPLGRGLLQEQKTLAKKEHKIEARRQEHLEWIADVQEKHLEVSASLLTHRQTLAAILASIHDDESLLCRQKLCLLMTRVQPSHLTDLLAQACPR